MSEKVDIQIVDEDNKDASEEAAAEHKPEEQPQDEPSVTEAEDLASRLEAAQKKADEHYDRLLRTSAEFDNYKKRTSREIQDIIKYANEKILKELLAVVDNLERAIAAVTPEEQESNPLLQGVTLTMNELLKLLEGHAVKPIQALGEAFDPAFHQAMMQEEADDSPPNTVVRELQKGYMIHDRLLRPALVGVSKASDQQPGDNDRHQEE